MRPRRPKTLWRTSRYGAFAFAGMLVMLLCAIVLLLIVYSLLKPVSRNMALLAVFFNLVSISADAINNLHHYSALLILRNADSLKAFEPAQLNALALLSLKLFNRGYDVSLLFFGFFCLCTGYLIYKSGFFPRIVGLLMAISGLCYGINTVCNFLLPRLASRFSLYLLLLCFVGEASLCLWLMIKGVNEKKWEEVARAHRESGAYAL